MGPHAEEDPSASLVQHERAMDERVVHLQQAFKEVSRLGRNLADQLLQHDNGRLAVDDQLPDAAVLVIDHDQLLSLVLRDDRQVEIEQVALDPI